jgi:SAM-dependent methyltransferase
MPHGDIDRAIERLLAEFPFDGYFGPGLESHAGVARECLSRLLGRGRILDIGCGPVDKTAVLSYLGFECTGLDDFNDPWHRRDGNTDKIRGFAERAGIALVERDGNRLPFADGSFDAAIICDVIEHLHESPRAFLAEALRIVREDGLILVTVPNAANLRKRLHLLLGKTNYPPYDQFFWNEGPWRGHVREYVWDDLIRLAEYLDLADVRVQGCHHMLGVLPTWARAPYKMLTAPLPGARDSLMLSARKPQGWRLPPNPTPHHAG